MSRDTRLHDADRAFIIVAIGALIAVVIAVSALTTSAGGGGHRLLHSVDGRSEPAPPEPSAVEIQSRDDEVRALRVVVDPVSGDGNSIPGRGTRTAPLAEPAARSDRAVRVIVGTDADVVRAGD